MLIRSCGMALKPCGHAPVCLSASATWSRWLALSAFLPSQQPAKSCTRMTLLPFGQITYLSESRSSNPLQVHVARALAGPRLVGFASPTTIFRNFGIAVTLLVALPRYSIFAWAGRTILPTLPTSSRFGPDGTARAASPPPLLPPLLLPLLLPPLLLPPLLLPPLLLPPLLLPPPALSVLSLHGARLSRPCGFWALRPMAMAIRSIVATRLSFNGPRMALLMKFGPPCPL